MLRSSRSAHKTNRAEDANSITANQYHHERNWQQHYAYWQLVKPYDQYIYSFVTVKQQYNDTFQRCAAPFTKH